MKAFFVAAAPIGFLFCCRFILQAAGVDCLMKTLLLFLIRLYQKFISPLLPPSCRFYPSCSEYARQALAKYGALKGIWLATKRLARCHPCHAGGLDPVP